MTVTTVVEWYFVAMLWFSGSTWGFSAATLGPFSSDVQCERVAAEMRAAVPPAESMAPRIQRVTTLRCYDFQRVYRTETVP